MAKSINDLLQSPPSPFATRLRQLMAEGPTYQDQLATVIGKTRQTISQYVNGISEPGYDTLIRIADYFHVSTDYLIGASDVRSPNLEIQAICSSTGLSEIAIRYLQTLKATSTLPPQSNRLKVLSALLEQQQFDYLLALWEQYISLMQMETSLLYSQSPEYSFHCDALKKHGFVVSTPDDQAQVLFNERIANILQNLLDNLASAEVEDSTKSKTQ